MRKSIKRIIAIALTTISIFVIVGCGQSKEESKVETKQEKVVEKEVTFMMEVHGKILIMSIGLLNIKKNP